MSLLSKIQAALLAEGSALGPTLLKLRFLASRLGSDRLEDWVRHETEGYPKDVLVPDYRKTTIAYSGVFQGYGQILNDVPVPSTLISKHASPHWKTFEIRESISVIDSIIIRSEKNAQFAINAGDLQLQLQDKLMEHHRLVRLNGLFDLTAFTRVQAAVRAKVLDLTIELEKKVPEAATIAVGQRLDAPRKEAADSVTQITNTTVYGNATFISGSEISGSFTVNVVKGDAASLIRALAERGVAESDARELATIVEAETPGSTAETLGKRTKDWIADKARQTPGELWGMGKAAATELIKGAVKAYYGL
ncbi:hypothetical protein [Elioraea sp.]|uniref:AbiTii domain-containing protein n=1 Tax=Elioraea sp. TaxID=2185103 RepID=UPI003F7307D7